MADQSREFSSLGEVGLGIVFGAILYGIFILQTYIYAFRFKGDPLVVRLFVLWTFILDSLHQALLIHVLWVYLVNFDSPLILTRINWSYQAAIVIAYMMAFSVQLFYTYRIWGLTRNGVICGLIVFFSVWYMSFGIYYETRITNAPPWLNPLSRQSTSFWALEASLGCTIIADVAIAASLGLQLRHKLSEFDQMRSIMHKLISYAIGTGVLLVVVSLMTLIALAVSSSVGFAFFQVFFMLLPKLYTNSVMISLNARKAMRGDLSQTPFMAGHIPSNSIQLSITRGNDQHTYNHKSSTAIASNDTF